MRKIPCHNLFKGLHHRAVCESMSVVLEGGLMQTVHYSVKENGLLFRSVTVASAHSDTAIYTGLEIPA